MLQEIQLLIRSGLPEVLTLERQCVSVLFSAKGATICPSAVARAVQPDNWRPLMPAVRHVASRLAAEHRIDVRQRGRVVELNAEKNLVILGSAAELHKSSCSLKDVNWINDPSKLNSSKIQVKIRYRSGMAEADFVQDEKGILELKFSTPQRAITPGQACVFFQDDWCLGGGWITA